MRNLNNENKILLDGFKLIGRNHVHQYKSINFDHWSGLMH